MIAYINLISDSLYDAHWAWHGYALFGRDPNYKSPFLETHGTHIGYVPPFRHLIPPYRETEYTDKEYGPYQG